MVHRRRVIIESSSSSDSNSDSIFSSASSHKTSPTSPVENSAPSIKPLKCRKRKRDSSGNDNNNKTKSSKRPRSQKDHTEEPSHQEHTQNSGKIHFGEVQQVVITAHQGNVEDLDQAIALAREVLALRPVGHTDRSSSLHNLALQLSTCFDHRCNAKDLDQAIALFREALALRPVGHTDRSQSLHNLVVHLSTRFDHQGNAEDINESRENLRCALTLLTQHDPRRLMFHRSLATVYLSFHRSGLGGTGCPGEDTDSLNVAMHHFKAAANFVPGGLLPRLRASLRWVHHADEHRHATELDAYATSMQLMDAYMSATASVSSRHRAMKDFPRTLAVDAASCALRSGDVRRAVELLEQGRTIIWNQMTQLRTPLDNLQTHNDHAAALMKRFRDLSSLLDRPSASHGDGTPSVNVEAADARYRRLVEACRRDPKDRGLL